MKGITVMMNSCGNWQIFMARVLFLLCFSLLVEVEVAEIVPAHSGSVGFVQSIQDPKYTIEFHPPNSLIHKDPDQEMIVMTGVDGSKYECILPNLPQEHKIKNDDAQQNTSSINLPKDRRKQKTPNDLLDVLKDQCFLRHEGWWTYEFCYHGKIRQLHLENKKIVQEFILGVYDSEATAALHRNSPDVSLQKDPRSRSAAQRYHANLYTNGTTCDLTTEPRETEVRFVCADTGKAMISSITEAPSCKYTLIFHAPMICKHPLFQEERPQPLVINCVEISSGDDKEANQEVEEQQTISSGLLPVVDNIAVQK
eukprot:c22634_g1_i1 orf=174-1106(+)